jgi:hypothetical protein
MERLVVQCEILQETRLLFQTLVLSSGPVVPHNPRDTHSQFHNGHSGNSSACLRRTILPVNTLSTPAETGIALMRSYLYAPPFTHATSRP